MIKCDICGKEFEKNRSMTNHRRWHDLPEYKDYQKKFREDVRKRQLGKNNSFYGKTHSKQHKIKLSNLRKENILEWDKIGYNQKHKRMKKKISKPNECQICNKKRKLVLMNINHEYNEIIEEWKWVCYSCHEKIDIEKGLRRKYINPNRNKLGQFVKYEVN